MKEVKNKELEDREVVVDEKIEKEISIIIEKTKKALEGHKELFTLNYLKKINETLGELERIRKSNNIGHISEVANQIYKYLRHPDNINKGEVVGEVYKGIMESMRENALVKKNFEYEGKNGLDQIKLAFKKIGNQIKKLKKTKNDKVIEGKNENNLERILNKITEEREDNQNKTTILKLIKLLWSVISAPNKIVRATRRHELANAFSQWKGQKKQSKPQAASQSESQPDFLQKHELTSNLDSKIDPLSKSPIKPDTGKFSKFEFLFIELDSFLGWLLFFYISYFFLISFSLEKGIGLPSDFVIKTLKSPLILNITIFLVFSHLILRIKNLHFKRNTMSSMFLFLFGYGFYVLLISNF